MGRQVLVMRTGNLGHFMIPYEERLSIELCQSLIHHVYHRLRYPEFLCHALERDMKSEVYELFVEHDGVARIPAQHQNTLLNMGVGYLIELESVFEQLEAQTRHKPILLPISNFSIDRVALVV